MLSFYEVYPSFLANKHSIVSHKMGAVMDSVKHGLHTGTLIILLKLGYRDEQTKERLFEYEAREEINFSLEEEEKDKMDLGNLYIDICNKTFDFIAKGPAGNFARCELEESLVERQVNSIITNLKFNGFYQ